MLHLLHKLDGRNFQEIAFLSRNSDGEYTQKSINLYETVQFKQRFSEEFCRAYTDVDEIIDKSFSKLMYRQVLDLMEKIPDEDKIIEEVDPISFDVETLQRIILRHFRNNPLKTVRVWCSSETYAMLSKLRSGPNAIYPTRFSDPVTEGLTYSISVNLHNIPPNEIWVIEEDSWKIYFTDPLDEVYYDVKTRERTYTRRFNMSKPINFGMKLLCISLTSDDEIDCKVETYPDIVEDRSLEVKKMIELLAAVKIPNAVNYATQPMRGGSVWLGENPENSLSVAKETSVQPKKVYPQMFNPSEVKQPE